MKIIGHRGAAGLALENTTESIKAAIDAGVDAIEFDIRITKDKQLVLSHDRDMRRVTGKSSWLQKKTRHVPSSTPSIHQHSLGTLRQVPLHNGQKIATLSEAIKAAGNTPLVIEAKDGGWARPLADFMQKQRHKTIHSVVSFNHQELYTFSLLMPHVPVYALEQTKPLDVIRAAHLLGFTGIDLNFWILNPLTYALARYHKLEVIVYTVNKPWIARFLRIFYPNISITTDVPNKLQFLRKKRLLDVAKRKTRK